MVEFFNYFWLILQTIIISQSSCTRFPSHSTENVRFNLRVIFLHLRITKGRKSNREEENGKHTQEIRDDAMWTVFLKFWLSEGVTSYLKTHLSNTLLTSIIFFYYNVNKLLFIYISTIHKKKSFDFHENYNI